jgi:tetratricopeptide (TPR) repeat protein
MHDITQEDGVALFQKKRYAEASEAFRQFLAQAPPPGLEADTRRRLADALASSGRVEEAAAERELAANIAEASAGDPMALMTKGDLLKRDHRHDAACVAYEQSLRLLPSQPSPGRALLMAKLALAHHDASRPAKTVIWAGASLANKPQDAIRLMMHQMCGAGYSDLGDLERAEAHYARALAMAEAGGKAEEIAQSLTTLASVQRKRGQFETAIGTARLAAAAFAHPGRGAPIVEAECLRDMGRFEEARAVVAAMKQGPPYDRPDVEQRTQVIIALTLAWTEAAADRPEAALAALRGAWDGLGVSRDPPAPILPSAHEGDKLILYCDATAVRVYAHLGWAEGARRMRESVEARLGRFAQDRAGRLCVYGEFAPAALILGDYARCHSWWQQYLDCQPDVVGQTKAHCGLGEAWSRLGDAQAAREAFTQAVAPGINSLYARRARARLDELGG